MEGGLLGHVPDRGDEPVLAGKDADAHRDPFDRPVAGHQRKLGLGDLALGQDPVHQAARGIGVAEAVRERTAD